MRFPRLKDRGPIEAITRSAAASGGTFPRLKDRGPIEATDAVAVAPAIAAFPRLNDRGPIEAITTIGLPLGQAHFRG